MSGHLLAIAGSGSRQLPAEAPGRIGRNQYNCVWVFNYEGGAREIHLSGFHGEMEAEHGQEIHFTSSFAGSETITNQILQGVNAEIALLSIERDAERLKQGGFVTSDWHALPNKGLQA